MAKSKKERKNKRKLLLLILLLFVTLALLGSATYAWFTSNQTVNVDTMEVKVRSVNGLQISADAIDWKALVTKQELIDASNGDYSAAVNQFPTYLGNMSTVGAVNASGQVDMYYGSVRLEKSGSGASYTEQYLLNTVKEVETKCADGSTNECGDGRHFIAFDLFFKLDANATVKMTANSKVIALGDDKGIKNTARVAFVNLGHLDTDTYAEGQDDGSGNVTEGYTLAQQLTKSTGSVSDGTVKIWEPNMETHTVLGKQNATTNYGITDFASSAIQYQGAKAACADIPLNAWADSTAYPNLANCFEVVSPISTPSNNSSTIEFFDMEAGVTKVRVYFWVEGNDVDAENNATGSDMQLDLEFTIAS
jgi:hypothetical protein